MSEYLIVFEKTKTGYSAYSPDIDGCIAVGDTKEECETNMKEALKFHIEFMRKKGYTLPKPTKRVAEFVRINHRTIKHKQFANT